MKLKAIILLAGLASVCGCRRPPPALVPEISPPLIQEEVFAWKGRPAGNVIFPCAGGIGWVDESGLIATCDPGKKAAGAQVRLPFTVTDPPFRQGDLLVVRDGRGDRLLIFDLAGLTQVAELRRPGAGRILGVDRDCLVYLDGEKLAVDIWKDPAGEFRLEGPGEGYFNCHFFPERVLILGREHLVTFWKKSGKFERRALPQPAASPFFLDGEFIYFGTTQRFLLKYAPAADRLAWKLKLGQVLAREPLVFAGTVAVATGEQSFLQLNRRGSILWWQALGSTVSFDLLPMSDHLAVFLLNGDVQFIEPRRKQVTVFKSKGHPLAAPLALGHDVYFATQDGPLCKLQRIGNRYGIDIELEPAAFRWLGQSVRFAVQPRNLLEPEWDCVIRDALGKEVFRKSLKTAERVSLAWLPPQPGRYTLRVQARALNRNEEVELFLQILDPQRPLPGFYLQAPQTRGETR